jgi:GntR family transcriptional repressor for pyruvate dehydrogenase complex
MASETIKPAKLSDAVADHLEMLILEGALRPGERLLPERELSAKLDISRPSLREALTKLADRQLIQTNGNGVSFVSEAIGSSLKDPLVVLFRNHPEAAFEYLEFRNVVEGAATGDACRRASDVDRQEIKRCFERLETASKNDDPTEEAEADADFHLAIYEASHNLVMLHVMRSLSDLMRADVFFNRKRLWEHRGIRVSLLDEHRAIFDALMTGDADRARAAAQFHVSHMVETLREIKDAERRLEASLRRLGRDAFVVPNQKRDGPGRKARQTREAEASKEKGGAEVQTHD